MKRFLIFMLLAASYVLVFAMFLHGIMLPYTDPMHYGRGSARGAGGGGWSSYCEDWGHC